MLSIHLRLGLPSGLFPSAVGPTSYIFDLSLDNKYDINTKNR
jgi:hypothetical protein